jgi:4-aminobutyrate aminotransferase-like enzyme
MGVADDFDAVLAAEPPAFTIDRAVQAALDAYDVTATSALDLGSERDQTFLLIDAAATPIAVMKISNPAEDPEILDMETLVVRHAQRADPTLPIAAPRPRPRVAAVDDPTAYRALTTGPNTEHWVRMYDVLPGHSRLDPLEMSDAAIADFGQTTARLGRALRGFFHPRAQRTMLWDAQHAAHTRGFLPHVTDLRMRDIVERTLDRFDTTLEPLWPSLRAQVIHTDLSTDNALLDDHGRVTGIVDFGDMSHTALLVDVASAIDALTAGRRADDRFRVARLVLDGYQRVTPLEPDELRVLGELWATRCAISVAISSWRVARELADAAFAQRNLDEWIETLDLILTRGWTATARALGAETFDSDHDALFARRAAALGPAIEALSYDHAIHIASASGVWMTATDGRRYLDAYNNVPCVGHGHPRVTEAIARQSRRINTNLRYLHDGAIELAERLIATCPPELDTVFFVNSGSEANDLAWRMATTATNHRGGLCTEFAYHGISDATAPFSRETWPVHRDAPVESWAPANSYRNEHLDDGAFLEALDRLHTRGLGLAAVMLDGVMQSDGVLMLEPDYVQQLVAHTHAAGGLWIADEVQGGHGRTGEGMWSFQRFGITPDFVTLGKPMGNGHPVAAVITRRDIADQFAGETVFFSTFGGNPVSVAAALAVLDVIDDERVIERTRIAGGLLRHAVRELALDHRCVGDVRGVGLANGIEIVRPETAAADPHTTEQLKNQLRSRGVLVGSCGKAGNVLKVRPPLAFTAAEVPIFTEALAATLGALA